MFTVKFDGTQLNKILKNAVSYSQGYLEGVEFSKPQFYQELATCTLDTMNKYIDSQARMNPEKLHHVYEWGMVGSEKGRLFKFDVNASKNNIKIKKS